MKEFILRDYQENQLKFLQSHISNNAFSSEPPKLFKDDLSLQSPTGSGKSITMLKFVQEYFKTHSGKIFISTGFNELVHQFYETAQSFNIPCVVLIGKANCACYRKKAENFGNPFDPNATPKCNPDECLNCRRYRDCYYNKHLDRIERTNNLLVITNHSTLLAKLDFFKENFIGGFLDECQSFPDFYRNYLTIEITPSDVDKLLDLNNEKGCLDKIKLNIIATNVNKGKLNAKNLRELTRAIDLLDSSEKDDHLIKLKRDIYRIPFDEDDPNVYFYPQLNKGNFAGLKVTYFFDKINLGLPVCLTSATVDSYTKNLFRVDKQENQYNEENCHLIDYSQSYLEIFDEYSLNKLVDFVEKQDGNYGLFLSTRLDLVKEVKNEGYIFDYKIVTNRKDLEKEKKAILVGSKTLFQGIDLGNIDFVMINKIPFPKYDDFAQKQDKYFTSLGKEPYRFYTVPYTINQLTQCMGRLWRKPGDSGKIALFDKGVKTKHRMLLKESLSYRQGIKTHFHC